MNDWAESNKQAAAAEYGRGPAGVTVPLETLNDLIDAGDQLNYLNRVSSCEEAIAEARWFSCTQDIKTMMGDELDTRIKYTHCDPESNPKYWVPMYTIAAAFLIIALIDFVLNLSTG